LCVIPHSSVCLHICKYLCQFPYVQVWGCLHVGAHACSWVCEYDRTSQHVRVCLGWIYLCSYCSAYRMYISISMVVPLCVYAHAFLSLHLCIFVLSFCVCLRRCLPVFPHAYPRQVFISVSARMRASEIMCMSSTYACVRVSAYILVLRFGECDTPALEYLCMCMSLSSYMLPSLCAHLHLTPLLLCSCHCMNVCSLCVPLHVCLFHCLLVFVSLRVSASVCESAFLCLRVRVSLCIYYVYVYMYVSVYVFVFLWVSLCTWFLLCLTLCLNVPIYACPCICLCVYVWFCMVVPQSR
jgi:hypothetical protein